MKSDELALVFARVVAVVLTACGSDTTASTTPPTDGGIDPQDAGVVLLEGGAKLDANPDDPCSAVSIPPPDASDTCGDFVRYPCGLPPNTDIRQGCYMGVNDCAALCPDVHYSCTIYAEFCDADAGKAIPDKDGGVVIDCSICKGVAGRRPAGLLAASMPSKTALGAWLAETAHLEAASVHAFRQLARDLAAHGAPVSLIDGCASAISDEIRHARAVGRLARRFGGTFAKPRIAKVEARSFFEIARENAVEGCVRETFAALVATWQGQHALPEIADVFARIAEDETRHAALAWSVAEWAMPLLSVEERAAIARECEAVVAELDQSEDVPGAGLPDRSARRLLAGVFTELLTTLSAAVAPNESMRSGSESRSASCRRSASPRRWTRPATGRSGRSSAWPATPCSPRRTALVWTPPSRGSTSWWPSTST